MTEQQGQLMLTQGLPGPSTVFQAVAGICSLIFLGPNEMSASPPFYR